MVNKMMLVTLIAKASINDEDEDGLENNSDVPNDDNDDDTAVEGDLTFNIPQAVYNGTGTLTYTLDSVTVNGVTVNTGDVVVSWNSSTGRHELDTDYFQSLGYGDRDIVKLNYTVSDGLGNSSSNSITDRIHGRELHFQRLLMQ